MASEPTLSSLAALAASSSAVDDDAYSADPSSSNGAPKTKEQLRRHYVRALHKVIDEADIIVLVLDARDPEGYRSRLVEEEVRRREAEGKRLVFVLNKVGECSFSSRTSISERKRVEKNCVTSVLRFPFRLPCRRAPILPLGVVAFCASPGAVMATPAHTSTTA